MAEHVTAKKRSDIWPVAFPDEKLIVKRPSLRQICQGNADLADLISYFLYEVGREATWQGIDPQTIWAATLYRTQEQMLNSMDHSTTRKVLRRNTFKLEQLGFLKVLSQQHGYTILVEKIRQALALRPQQHMKEAQTKLSLPSTRFYLSERSYRSEDFHTAERIEVPMNCVNIPTECVEVPMNCVNIPTEMGKPTQFYIDPAASSQAASMGAKDDLRDNRDNREIKREDKREADAMTPSSFSSSSISVHKVPSPQLQHGQAVIRSSGGQEETGGEGQNDLQGRKDATPQAGGPEKPDCNTPPTIEAFLALADFYRGYRLARSKKLNSPYCLALEAATILTERRKTLTDVDAVFAYMKGVDQHFCDDWWSMKTVDLWHVARHFDSMCRQMAQRRAYSSQSQAAAKQSNPGFQMRQVSEIMRMPLEERRLYLSLLREQKQQQANH